MTYTWEEVENGKEYWAYDYSTNNTEKSMGLKAQPYRCVIDLGDTKRSYRYGFCVKLNKNGKALKSGMVNAWSREYADTEYEAVLAYNKLIDNQIDFLKSMISDHELDKIMIVDVNAIE